MSLSPTSALEPSKLSLTSCLTIARSTVQTTAHSETIKTISPDFAQVFTQAEEAESRNLKLVCGPGYRKALEFLVKDYVIKSHPDKAPSTQGGNWKWRATLGLGSPSLVSAATGIVTR